jgi:hypothetical protein
MGLNTNPTNSEKEEFLEITRYDEFEIAQMLKHSDLEKGKNTTLSIETKNGSVLSVNAMKMQNGDVFHYINGKTRNISSLNGDSMAISLNDIKNTHQHTMIIDSVTKKLLKAIDYLSRFSNPNGMIVLQKLLSNSRSNVFAAGLIFAISGATYAIGNGVNKSNEDILKYKDATEYNRVMKNNHLSLFDGVALDSKYLIEGRLYDEEGAKTITYNKGALKETESGKRIMHHLKQLYKIELLDKNGVELQKHEINAIITAINGYLGEATFKGEKIQDPRFENLEEIKNVEELLNLYQ